MRRRLDEFSQDASALGQAGMELARAEVSALSSELKLSSKAFLRIVLLLGGCLFALFWAIAVLIFAGIEVGALWLPRWGAALAVFGLLLAVVLIIGAVARVRLRRLDSPAKTVRRRVADLLEWWQRRIVSRDH